MTTNTDRGIREDADPATRQEPTDRAKEELGRVAETARTGAGEVVEVAKGQGLQLLTEAQQRLTTEAEIQTRRASESLRSVSAEFRNMAEISAQQGAAASWVRMGADGIESFADRLDTGGFEGLANDVGGFARRNPGAFLAVTFGAGLLVGRLVKNMNGHATSQVLSEPMQSQPSSPNPGIEEATSS